MRLCVCKKISRFVCALMIGVLVIGYLYKALSWKDTIGSYLSTYKELQSTPANTIDVAFVGSSHVYCGIYPSVLWNNYGIASFDMSVSGMFKETSLYALEQLYKTQKPKVVVLDLYSMFIEKSDGDEANTYRNMMGMDSSIDSIKFVLKSDSLTMKEKASLILRWPIIHTRYSELEKYDFIQNNPSVYGRGSVFTWDAQEIADETCFMTDESEELSEDNKQWLDSFIDIAQNNGSKVIVLEIPTNYDYDYQQKMINGASEYLKEKNVTFYDFNRMRDEIGIEEASDFLDYNHLNAYGAEKLSDYLGNLLVSSYGINSHKGDADYDLWELDLKNYYHQKFEYEIQNTEAGVLSALVSGEDLVTVICVNGDASWEEIGAQLGDIDITKEDVAEGGAWIFEKGEKVQISDEIYTMNLGEHNFIKIDASGEKTSISFNDKVYDMEVGVNVVAYDAFLNKVIYDGH